MSSTCQFVSTLKRINRGETYEAFPTSATTASSAVDSNEEGEDRSSSRARFISISAVLAPRAGFLRLEDVMLRWYMGCREGTQLI